MKMRRNNPDHTWFLTSVHASNITKHPNRDEFKVEYENRCFGHYRGWSKAYKAVRDNQGNMHECLYNYLVMERIGEGVHALTEDEQWFAWNGKQWKPCGKPQWAKGFTNWAIG